MFNLIRKFYGAYLPFYKKITHDNIFAVAGQCAFFLILTLVPLSMFAVSILQNLHIPISALEEVLSVVLNKQATAYVSNFLGNVSFNSVSVSFVTLIVTLWSAAQGIHAITNGLNRVHHTYENRNWFMLRIRAMFYTAVFVLIIILTALIIVLGSAINDALTPYIPQLPYIVALLYHLRYVIVFLYLVVLFALIYRNIPNLSREKRRENGFKYQLPGALFCAVAWFVLSLGISIYVGDFNGFSIYGSLTKLAVMMIWLYFCIVCLMIGAELNYVYRIQIKYFMDNVLFKKKPKKDNKGD